MIFKKLFKTQPKWQHDDVQVRLTALEALEVSSEKERVIIDKMAFEDDSEKVRLAGLNKLNDFAIWTKAAKKDKSDVVKRKAEEQIRKGLLGEAEFSVDDTIRQHFIDNCHKSQLLEELALKDKDEKVRLKLLQKLNKPTLLLQSMQDGSDWLKQQLIANIDELPVLEKLRKKASAGAKELLDDKINAIKEAIEKPQLLQKDVSLMLAKLNALKDKTDIVDIEARREQLDQQWQAFKQQFELFNETQAIELTKKYDKISHSLDNLMAPLKQKWQQQQQKLADAQTKAANAQSLNERINAIESKLTQALVFHSDDNEQGFIDELKVLRQDMQGMNLGEADKQQFIARSEKLYQKVEQIPQIAACVNEAMNIVKQLDALPLPQDHQQLAQVYGDYLALQKAWKTNQDKLDMTLPDTITTGYQQLNEQWQQTVAPLLKQQEQQLSGARKGLSELRFLLTSGKYRRAFGLFKKVTFMLESLTEKQRERLSRDYETIKAKIEDLADWQEYIATPRKQQLLEQMQELADNPVESPQEQAQKVKFTRQMWNSLGRSDDESDLQINQQFDEVCEQAFEVCRVYYAEQEVIRARNLEAKEAICEQLRQTAQLLEQEPIEWQKIESALAAARKDYKNAGDVDREQISAINDKFYGLVKPIQEKLRAYHQQNATLKEQLVAKAKALLDTEDVFDATNELKNLQKSWKTIGFAGSKADSAIWKKFRQINDEIFAKRDALKTERNQAEQAKVTQLSEQLDGIVGELTNAQTVSELNQHKEKITAIGEQIKTLAKGAQAKLNQQLSQLEKEIAAQKQTLLDAKHKARYQALFAQFEQISKSGELSGEPSEEPSDDINLEGQWKQILQTMPDSADQQQRHDLTIRLEIAAGATSPHTDSERRKNIQMELLSAKMNGGQLQDQEQLLKDWIALGRLDVQDAPLLDRVKALYL